MSTEFGVRQKGAIYHTFFKDEDKALADLMDSMRFLSDDLTEIDEDGIVETYEVTMPTDTWGFLHEAAIIEFKGVLYAAWYNNHEKELKGENPIRAARSEDGGKTWIDEHIVITDPEGKTLYCPPVFGVQDGKLYMFMNAMSGPDLMHTLELWQLNEQTQRYERLWEKEMSFKLNTNVVTLPNGKLLLSGRTGDLDAVPMIPAVMISDSGKIEGEWRMVKVKDTIYQPDGKKLYCPETSVIVHGARLYMFCRNDGRFVPLVFVSDDLGETWSEAMGTDMPLIDAKIYTGTLTDGRNYLIGNLNNRDRSEFVIYFSKPHSMEFNKVMRFKSKYENSIGLHYPVAHEWNGKLYVIHTIELGTTIHRGCLLEIIDLSRV